MREIFYMVYQSTSPLGTVMSLEELAADCYMFTFEEWQEEWQEEDFEDYVLEVQYQADRFGIEAVELRND